MAKTIVVEAKIEVCIDRFSTSEILNELQTRRLTSNNRDFIASILNTYSLLPKNMWDEQITEEVNTLLAKMTPLQALEALRNLNK